MCNGKNSVGRFRDCVRQPRGIEITENNDKASATAGDLSEFGSPGSLPRFQHADVKIAQSGAIEAYLGLVALHTTSCTIKNVQKY